MRSVMAEDQGPEPEPDTSHSEPADGGVDSSPTEPDDGLDSLPEQARDELRKLRGEARSVRRERNSLRSKLKEFEDRDKTELQRLTERLQAAEQRAQGAELKAMRQEIVASAGLDSYWASRLTGATREELEDDAKALKEKVQGSPELRPTNFNGGVRHGTVKPVTMTDVLREAAQRG